MNHRYRKWKLPARCATPFGGPRKSTGVPKALYFDIERESDLAPRIPDILKKWSPLGVGTSVPGQVGRWVLLYHYTGMGGRYPGRRYPE